jgi:hypothetical protein
LYRPAFWHILARMPGTHRGYATILLLLLASATVTAFFPRPSAPVAVLPAAQLGVANDSPDPWPDPAVIAERKRAAEGRPLFRASEPLAFTLRADFQTVQKDRAPESTTMYPATLVVARVDGTDASIPVRIRTRGHSRRKPTFCTFAPLRIEFLSDPVGTVFEGHKALKLGTHCRDQNNYEQYVLREYAVYQMFNLLTPRSFRARLGMARYVDAKKDKPVEAKTALFLEDDDDVARRLEGRASDQLGVPFRGTDLPTTTLMTLFEYMIGNTDMSITGLHNVRLVQIPAGTRFPIPYDFDYSGVVNAQYAVADPRLGIKSVRERVYRGPCRTVEEFEEFFARFRAVRPAIVDVYNSVPNLNARYIRQAQEYLDEFYRIIDRPESVRRAFIDKCGGQAGM